MQTQVCKCSCVPLSPSSAPFRWKLFWNLFVITGKMLCRNMWGNYTDFLICQIADGAEIVLIWASFYNTGHTPRGVGYIERYYGPYSWHKMHIQCYSHWTSESTWKLSVFMLSLEKMLGEFSNPWVTPCDNIRQCEVLCTLTCIWCILSGLCNVRPHVLRQTCVNVLCYHPPSALSFK